ncbi:MAG: peptidoglycan-binding domain-containing protein [Sulfitobacter geojensis]
MALLKIKSKGKDVEALQKLLNKAKSKPTLKIDGDFGPLTQKSLIFFQSKFKKHVKPDGQYGPKSAYALDAYLNGPKVKMEFETGYLADLAQEWETVNENARSRGAHCRMPKENAEALKKAAAGIAATSKSLDALFDEMDAMLKVMDKAMLVSTDIGTEFQRGGYASKEWTLKQNKLVAKHTAIAKQKHGKKFEDRLRALKKEHNAFLKSVSDNTRDI